MTSDSDCCSKNVTRKKGLPVSCSFINKNNAVSFSFFLSIFRFSILRVQNQSLISALLFSTFTTINFTENQQFYLFAYKWPRVFKDQYNTFSLISKNGKFNIEQTHRKALFRSFFTFTEINRVVNHSYIRCLRESNDKSDTFSPVSSWENLTVNNPVSGFSQKLSLERLQFLALKERR